MKSLNEESEEFKGIYESWKEEARQIKNPDQLREFAQKLLGEYEHDYGTAVRVSGTIAAAAAWMCAEMEGMTGFQASCVMWEFVQQFIYTDNFSGLRMLNFDDMLYPQNEGRFEKVIGRGTFEALQEKAAKRLSEDEKFTAPEVKAHWERIVGGEVPYGYRIKQD